MKILRIFAALLGALCLWPAVGSAAVRHVDVMFAGEPEPEGPAYDAEAVATFYGFETLMNGGYTATFNDGAYRFARDTTWSGNDDGLSVLVRYSGYAQPTADANLVTLRSSAVGSGTDNGAGVFARASDGTVHGLWNNSAWTGSDGEKSKVQVCDRTVAAAGYLVMTYKGNVGSVLYDGAGSVIYQSSALMTRNAQQVGGLVTVGSASATMTVEGVRIFKGVLAQDEIAAAVEDFENDMPVPEGLDEMYRNRLSGGDDVIPAGRYGSIIVPEGGYAASAFDAAEKLSSTASGDEIAGSCADIIKKTSGDTDIAEHTLTGWFKVGSLPTAEGAANAKTICSAKSNDGNYGGYKVAVDRAGRLHVGQCDDENWRNDSGRSTVYTTAAVVTAGTWFHLAVAMPGRVETRTTTATVFVNGVRVETAGGPFGTNLNGNKCEYVRIGGKGVTSGLGIGAAGICVNKTALTNALAVAYLAKHSAAAVPTVKPEITKDESAHAWTVDTTKIAYGFTSSEIAKLKSTAWKVTLKSASAFGATVGFRNQTSAQASHFVIESGTHAIIWSGEAANIDFSTSGTAEDPSILVKDGATLNLTTKDLTGWQGEAQNKTGNLIRVNGGGTLNLQKSGSNTHYYQGRYWLDPDATVTADFDQNKFRLNGGAVAGSEQLYVPASDAGSPSATLTATHDVRLAKDTMAGLGVFVGENSTLAIDADLTSDGAQPLMKNGAGTLKIAGALTGFTGTFTVNAGTLELTQPTLGGSLVMAAGTTLDIAHAGEIADGAVLLSAGGLDIGGATLLVNGQPGPEVHVLGGEVVVGKAPVTTFLNPIAVREGEALKVSCNAEAAAGEAAKAYDGDDATYFAPGDAANARGVSWTGIEFTNGVIVTRIECSAHTPRRMIGGAFQGANAADFSDAENICAIDSYAGGSKRIILEEAKGPYRYLRFIGMQGGNVSEIRYYGLAESGDVAPTKAPTIAGESVGGVARLTLTADTTVPQVHVVQRAMASFCEDDDYESFVTLAPQPGGTATWIDTKPTGYAKYRARGFNANGTSAWTYFEIVPERLIAGAAKPSFGGDKPGFYAEQATVEITYPVEGAKIYYTTDGSTPTTNATLYAGPITLVDVCGRTNELSRIRTNPTNITGNDYAWREPTADQPNVNVIRARAFLPDGSASTNDVAGTWMVGPTANAHKLRVISLQTDCDNFFGEAKGIMVPGDIFREKGFGSHPVGMPNANYFQSGDDWERPTQLEVFETDGKEMLSAQVGARVRGFWSRAAAKKSLTCYFRKEYGTKNAKLALFGDEGKKKFKRFILRSGGNDWYKFGFRDALGQAMFRGYVSTGTQGFEPGVLYVNGEYWGLYNFRHCYSKHHFEEWNGGVGDDIDHVKLTPEDGTHFELQEGDLNAMWNILQHMVTCTADGVMDDAEYARVESEVDIADMIDYHVVNIFLGNNDWMGNGNNMGLWRNRRGDDRKWHFTVYDCDSAMSYDGDSYATDHIQAALNANDTNDGATKMAPCFFKRCVLNEGFRRRFANRYADLLNTALRSERTTNLVARTAAKVEHELKRNADRWTNIGSVSNWSNQLATVIKFFDKRPEYAFAHIRNHFSSGDLADLAIACEGAGRVKLNTIESGKEFALPFTGTYFTDIPVTLVATPEAGFAFAGWKIGGAVVSTEAEMTLTPTNGVTVTAVFETAVPTPPGEIAGEYPDGTNIVLTADTVLPVGNATFGGPLAISGANATLLLSAGATARIPKIVAEKAIVIDGAGTLVMSNDAQLVTCAGMTVTNGTVRFVYTGGVAESKAVELKGDYRQYGGSVTMDLVSKNEVYGFWTDTKKIVVKILGGTFDTTIDGGAKSATFKLGKGSNDVTLGGGEIRVTLAGAAPRFVQTKAKLTLSGSTLTLAGDAPNARVFKSVEKMKVSGGLVKGEATGAGSEIFSADDEIEVKGGVICVTAADDCFSAQTNVVVSGGKVQALSTAGDAIDSNGSVEIKGGYVFANSLAGDGYGIEADDAFVISGGSVVAVGAKGVLHTPDGGSVACYTNAAIVAMKKYVVLTSAYSNRLERLSVNLKSGEKRRADGFSLVASVPNMEGVYDETDTKPSEDTPKGAKLDKNLDGVFVTTVARTPVEPGTAPALQATTEAAAKKEVAAYVAKPTAADEAAGVTAEMLKMEAEPVTNGLGAVVGYRAQVTVNPETVDAPAVGGDAGSEVEPLSFGEENEDGRAVSVGVVNAVRGLWYGYEVAEDLGVGFANDVESFKRANGDTVKITGKPRKATSGFFRVKVLPTKPTK